MVSILPLCLIFVAILRVGSAVVGYADAGIFRRRVFNEAPPREVTALAGRTFGVWTAVTCTLCLLRAVFVDEYRIHYAALAPFVLAIAYFALELFLYGTLNVRGALSPFIVASKSSAARYKLSLAT